MININWNKIEGRWLGICPRCNTQTYFESKSTIGTLSKIYETLFCPGSHAFLVEYSSNDHLKKILICSPIDHDYLVPKWLPEIYHDAYKELLYVRAYGYTRSVVSVCAILLEAHVNELIKNTGEKRKTLYDKLELLKSLKAIDEHQFTNATITRLTRNEVLHPSDILNKIEPVEAEVVFEEITNFLEGTFRFKSSKALPEPKATDESISIETVDGSSDTK